MINITQYLCIHFYIQSIFRYNKYMFINYFKKKLLVIFWTRLETINRYIILFDTLIAKSNAHNQVEIYF